jgi:hypothetical protein
MNHVISLFPPYTTIHIPIRLARRAILPEGNGIILILNISIHGREESVRSGITNKGSSRCTCDTDQSQGAACCSGSILGHFPRRLVLEGLDSDDSALFLQGPCVRRRAPCIHFPESRHAQCRAMSSTCHLQDSSPASLLIARYTHVSIAGFVAVHKQ